MIIAPKRTHTPKMGKQPSYTRAHLFLAIVKGLLEITSVALPGEMLIHTDHHTTEVFQCLLRGSKRSEPIRSCEHMQKDRSDKRLYILDTMLPYIFFVKKRGGGKKNKKLIATTLPL